MRQSVLVMIISDTLNQSGLVVRTETFEKGTDTILIHSIQGLKHIFHQTKRWSICLSNYLSACISLSVTINVIFNLPLPPPSLSLSLSHSLSLFLSLSPLLFFLTYNRSLTQDFFLYGTGICWMSNMGRIKIVWKSAATLLWRHCVVPLFYK